MTAVVELTLVVDNTEEFKKELFNQIMEAGGHTAEEAFTLVNQKLAIEKEIAQFRRSIKVPRHLPLELVDTKHPDIDKILFNIGFDTINSKWMVDVCCYMWQGSMKCGAVVLGTERLDKKWLQSDRKSDDAFYYTSREVLRDGMKR